MTHTSGCWNGSYFAVLIPRSVGRYWDKRWNYFAMAGEEMPDGIDGIDEMCATAYTGSPLLALLGTIRVFCSAV